MNAPANTRSFRLRLALQTMLVAGALVAAFGSAAWWYASQILERSVDDRIIAPAQRVWNRIDPYTADDEFKIISDLVFGSSPSQAAQAVLVVQDHRQGKTIFATPNAPKDLDVYFRSCFPTAEEISRVPPQPQPGGPPGPPGPRRPRREADFDDLLGLPPDLSAPPEQGLPFRPQMPMLHEPSCSLHPPDRAQRPFLQKASRNPCRQERRWQRQ